MLRIEDTYIYIYICIHVYDIRNNVKLLYHTHLYVTHLYVTDVKERSVLIAALLTVHVNAASIVGIQAQLRCI